MPRPRSGDGGDGAGRPLALAGRVVTMDDGFTVHDDGVVYVRDGEIAAVQDRDAAAPGGFEEVAAIETNGTIFPGLIELHNHLSYNALQLWDVPKTFTNRDQWAQGDEYRKLVTGPMKVLAHTPACVQAVVRYVECKCLLGGTTTSQGIALSSFSGIQHFYRGIVRNVEEPDDPALRPAASHIADVDARDRQKFLTRLERLKCLLLHLSEGTDERARAHFLALHGDGDDWAIRRSLAGIHCVALKPEDFETLARHHGSMVWSPLSNLLLYGHTADVKAAKEAGVRLGIGPDWGPSGSKNVLGELKVARLASHVAGDVLSDRELVALATRNAAEVLQWQERAGSLEPGKIADLLVIDGADGDPYDALFRASESTIALVVIGGVARFGRRDPVNAALGDAADGAEHVSVGGRSRLVYLHQPTGDPDVGKLTLAEATSILTDALGKLPELARDLDSKPALALLEPTPGGTPPMMLVLDHDETLGVDLRPHLPGPDGEPTGELETVMAAATPLPDLLVPLKLDPLTAVDDSDFATTLAGERNLPREIKAGLREVF
jgi:cytosine/adenosine deaminase-related metal-dependent hydrolase